MRIVGAALSAVSLASCSVTPPPLQHSATGLSCVNLNQVAGRRGAGAAALDFEMSNGIVYRNHLQGSCPGLGRLGSTLSIATVSGGEGGQLCRGDRVRVFDPVEAQATGLSAQPTCVLGNFTEIPPS